MDSDEIERRLRLPAPDEPSVLPALILPAFAADMGRGRAPVRMGSAFGSGSPIPAVAVMGLLLAAMLGLILSGALRLEQLPNPFDESNDLRRSGVNIVYPNDWHELVTREIPVEHVVGEVSGPELSTVALVSNVELPGCQIDEVACFTALALPPGAIRVRVLGSFRTEHPSAQPRVTFADAIPEDGWTYHIDGMPARLDVDAQPAGGVADEVRRWSVIWPGRVDLVWVVEAALRGPDLEALRVQADGIAKSMTFDDHPVPLDPTDEVDALGRIVDQLDREQRWASSSKFYACFPRTEGARAATITEGPHALLPAPASVTCASEISATAVHLWRVKLTVTWDAGVGYGAGRWAQEFWVDATGQSVAGGMVEGGEAGGSGLPEAPRALPEPLAAPVELPVGSLAEILPPGRWLDPAPDPLNIGPSPDMIGRHVYLFAGPEIVDGVPWYHVQWLAAADPSTTGWLPATQDGRPLLRIVEATCPPTVDLDVPDLAYLTAAERLLCFGNDELELGPVTVRVAEIMPSTGERAVGPDVAGTPEWLAEESRWQLWGSAGPDGLDGPIRVSIDPSLGTTLPTDGWLTVRGHFDDPASGSCQRTRLDLQDPNGPSPEPLPSNVSIAPGPEPESPALQVLRCREHFVVTSFETVAP